MRYKNTKTGAIINSSSKIVGKNWVEFEGVEKEVVVEAETAEETTDDYIEEEINLDEMTKDQLIKLAKEQEVEINEKDKKEVIIETIAKAFE